MRVFEYSIKALDNQVIDQILESSNTQINLIYRVINNSNFNPDLKDMLPFFYFYNALYAGYSLPAI